MNRCTPCRPRPAARLTMLWLLLGVLAPACAPPDNASKAAPNETTWESCYVHGDKVGFVETTVTKYREGTRDLVQIDSHSQLGFHRFGDASQIDIRTTSVETPYGDVLHFTVTSKMGPQPLTIRGEVAGRELALETEMAGKTQTSRMPWESETRGFQGIERSLERNPMQPGETRRLSLLVPVPNIVVADVELVAKQLETTKLLDGSRDLLHIDCQLTLPGAGGNGIRTVIWTDEQGRTIKTFLAGIEQESFRTTREQATEPPKGLHFDFGTDMLVKVERALPPPAQTRRVRYRVEIDGDDPSKLFAATPNQHVTKTGDNTAEIVVTAPRYNDPAPDVNPQDTGPTKQSLPTPDDSAPNNLLQSDDATIVAMAREARGKAQGPLAIARALEAYVHRTVSSKNFSQAFASALEVAQSHEGDCTEHAVLLAALARASELPARVVFGLVYVTSKQGFGYHMWTEVFDGKRWLPLDATLGRGGIGASHLELGESNLKDSQTLTSLISLVQVFGKLKIEVLEAE